MAKKFLVLALAAIMILGIFGLSGCKSGKHNVYEEGYFQYIIVGENSSFPQKGEDGVVTIVGFTELGKEQEVIDFPREIDGKPVTKIGYRDEGFYHNNSYHVYSEKLRKIYIHDNIENITYFEGEEVDVIFCSINKNMIGSNGISYGIISVTCFVKRYFVNKTLFEKLNYSYNTFPANIEYLNNYSTQSDKQFYRIDNIDLGNKIPEPPVPVRAGYSFIGWYTEPECINVWDFETVPNIADKTEFRLYASWQKKL